MPETQPLLPKSPSRRSFLLTEVDPSACILLLSILSTVTGITSFIAYNSTNVWNGFLTGSTLQSFASLTKVGKLEIEDYQRFTSISSFGAGAVIGSAITRRYGGKSRIGLVLRSIISFASILGAGVCLVVMYNCTDHTKDEEWRSVRGFVALGLLSVSTGLQAIDGQSLQTEFLTTVVQTSVWLGLFTTPPSKLLQLRYTPERDLRLLSLLCLGLGATISQAILLTNNTLIGQAGSLFTAAGLKLLVCVGWLFVREDKEANGKD